MKTIPFWTLCLCLLGYFSPASSAELSQCVFDTLPDRDGPAIKTSGSVPHVQIGVDPVADLNSELHRLTFTLPGLKPRPTIVSLPGATGMWLTNDLPIVFPKAIVSGREFAHIHEDGSLHAPFTYTRALEIESKGWGERHPWADKNDGWQGLVMLYSATSIEQLSVLVHLVTESYNHITGQSVTTPGC